MSRITPTHHAQQTAIGTTEELTVRYVTYQVHFSCPMRKDMTRVQVLMSCILGTHLANDVVM